VPPLWEYWVSLLNGPDALHIDEKDSAYIHLQTKNDLFGWVVRTLYRTPGNDGIKIVRRDRVMALVLGVALAIVIALWAWKVAGLVAAVTATFLYCLDPNFIGHAPLVKNDVGFALVYFAAAYATWRLGRRFTPISLGAVALLTAAAVAVKLSGVLLAPVLLVALTARAFLPEPWLIFGNQISNRRSKLLAAAMVWVVTAGVTYCGLWASYGFQYDAGPGGLRSDTQYDVRALRYAQVREKVNDTPTDEQLAEWKMPFSTRLMLAIEDHHLLPQPWTSGYVLTQLGDEMRRSFLMNDIYVGGRWYYFPLAVLFKEPLAMIVTVVLAAGYGRRAMKRGLLGASPNRWTLIALATPALVYGAALLTMRLNIGLRHALPVYPFVMVAVGLAAARLWRVSAPKSPGKATGGRVLMVALGAALAGETVAAFPNYIAFFNMAVAPHRLELLSDSNLDWGQDLPLLKAWQDENPKTTLYLDYFGLCDPAAYGIRYINVPSGYVFGPKPVFPNEPGVVAISATNLQQAYGEDLMSRLLAGRKPMAILGNTIYLFKFVPPDFTPDTQP
jgi:hypothetical protein